MEGHDNIRKKMLLAESRGRYFKAFAISIGIVIVPIVFGLSFWKDVPISTGAAKNKIEEEIKELKIDGCMNATIKEMAGLSNDNVSKMCEKIVESQNDASRTIENQEASTNKPCQEAITKHYSTIDAGRAAKICEEVVKSQNETSTGSHNFKRLFCFPVFVSIESSLAISFIILMLTALFKYFTSKGFKRNEDQEESDGTTAKKHSTPSETSAQRATQGLSGVSLARIGSPARAKRLGSPSIMINREFGGRNGYSRWVFRTFKSVDHQANSDSGGQSQRSSNTAFKELAEKHQELSQLWFTISLAILLGGLIYAAFHVMEPACGSLWGFQSPHGGESAEIWLGLVHAIPNLFLYSIFYLAYTWSLRNYNAHWHKFLTNEHRDASLKAIANIRKNKPMDNEVRRSLDIQSALVSLMPSDTAYLEGKENGETTAAERLLKLEEMLRGLLTHGK